MIDEPIEQVFLRKVDALRRAGVDLRGFYVEGMVDIFGDIVVKSVLYFLGDEAIGDPDLFVKRINKIFGFGAEVIYAHLDEKADQLLGSRK